MQGSKTTWKRLCTIGGSIALLNSCISTHYGKEQAFVQDSLKISCAPDSSIDHDVVKSVSCALENTSDSWMNVNVSKFEPHLEEDRTVVMEVLSPERVQSFATAYKFQEQKTNHNAALVVGGLLVVTTAALTSNSLGKGPGLAVATAMGSEVALKASAYMDPPVESRD